MSDVFWYTFLETNTALQETGRLSLLQLFNNIISKSQYLNV